MAQQDYEFLAKLSAHIEPFAYQGEDGKSPYVDEEGWWWQFDDETREYKKTDARSDRDAAELAREAAQQALDAKQAASAAAAEARQQIQESAEAATAAAAEAGAQAAAARQGADEAKQAATQVRTQAAGVLETVRREAETTLSGAGAAAEGANQAAQRAEEAARRADEVAAKGCLNRQVVEALPEPEQMADDAIYAVKSKSPAEGDAYEEWWKVDGKAERFGGGGSGIQSGCRWYTGASLRGLDPEMYVTEYESREQEVPILKTLRLEPGNLGNSEAAIGKTATVTLSPAQWGWDYVHIDACYSLGYNRILTIETPDEEPIELNDGYLPVTTVWRGSLSSKEQIRISLQNNGENEGTENEFCFLLVVVTGEDASLMVTLSPEDFKIENGDTPETSWRVTQNDRFLEAENLSVGDYYIDNQTGQYFQCTEAGTENSKWEYQGQLFKPYQPPEDLSPAVTEITVDQKSFVFDGSPHCPTIQSVTKGGTELYEGNWNDYIVYGLTPQTGIGTYEYLILGTGREYVGVRKESWSIVSAES